jgi:hypothetical protein
MFANERKGAGGVECLGAIPTFTDAVIFTTSFGEMNRVAAHGFGSPVCTIVGRRIPQAGTNMQNKAGFFSIGCASHDRSGWDEKGRASDNPVFGFNVLSLAQHGTSRRLGAKAHLSAARNYLVRSLRWLRHTARVGITPLQLL